MAYSLTEQLRITSTEAVTARVGALTPTCNAYMTILRVHGQVSQPKRNLNQLMVVPFPNDQAQVEGDHLMLLNVVGSDSIFRALHRTTAATALAQTTQTADTAVMVLAPNFEALIHGTAWDEVNVAGDYERRMQAMKKTYGKGYGFAVVTPEYNLESGSVNFTVGWVWYGDTAAVPCASEGNAWIVNDGATALKCAETNQPCRGTHYKSASPRVVQYLELCTMHRAGAPETSKGIALDGPGGAYYASNTEGLLIAHRRRAIAPKRAIPPKRKPGAPKTPTALWIVLAIAIMALMVWFAVAAARAAPESEWKQLA